MPKLPRQLWLLQKEKSAYGGELLKTRRARTQGRPIATRLTMHLVLRSKKATRDWSFKKPENERAIHEILGRFSKKYGVLILSLANVGNHLHFQIKLSNRYTYKPFIRAITAAIAMAVTGINKWTKLGRKKLRFWDYRPFTRIVESYRGFLKLKDYIRINQLEGSGYRRDQARWLIAHGVDPPFVGANSG